LHLALERDVYRLPVFEGSTSNVVGLLRLNARRELETADLDGPVDALLSPVRFVPTSQPLSTVLPELLHREDQMLVVVDEYGSAVGIVTLNDLVYDVLGSGAWSAGAGGPRRAAKPLTDHGDGSFSLDPHLPMVELNELVGAELPTGEATTLAGFLLARLRRLPDEGDELAAGGFRFVIEAVDDRTIQRVRVFPA
jgi:putative hemolysin